MHIEVRESALRPWEELQRYESEVVAKAFPAKYGATATFLGSMRDFNIDDDVQGMTLEHYPGMTEKHLGKIADEAGSRWSLLDLLIIHRVGELLPGEPIVLVAVWSAHRKDAFEACRFLMEELKSRAPFWKKEQLESGHRWVEHNTDGY